MPDNAMPVQRIEKPDWHPGSEINREIAELVAHSYLDATALLERELAHNDLLYYIRDDEGRLATFFMVARECLHVDRRPTPSVFLGLGATSQRTKGSGLVRQLYRAFLTEARGWEQALDRPLLLWATTATPSAYYGAGLVFADLQPRPDGSFTAEGAAIANVLRRRYGLGPLDAGGNPFVMHDVATGTRYSPEEEARIEAICREKRFDLFEKTGVDQRNGDRLLVICRVAGRPSMELCA